MQAESASKPTSQSTESIPKLLLRRPDQKVRAHHKSCCYSRERRLAYLFRWASGYFWIILCLMAHKSGISESAVLCPSSLILKVVVSKISWKLPALQPVVYLFCFQLALLWPIANLMSSLHPLYFCASCSALPHLLNLKTVKSIQDNCCM